MFLGRLRGVDHYDGRLLYVRDSEFQIKYDGVYYTNLIRVVRQFKIKNINVQKVIIVALKLLVYRRRQNNNNNN